jgi:hypothetical protein
MTSPRRKQNKPVESVELKVTFRAGRTTIDRIKEAIPSAVIRDGACELRLSGEEATEIAAGARAMLEKVRAITGNPS